MRVEEADSSFIIYRNSGYAYVQRKPPTRATDDPLHIGEELILEMAQELSRLRGEVERYKSALNELCRLKAMKDQLGKVPEYTHFQPIAWRVAFELLEIKSD